jgi:ABC-type Zn uptake system ZnuABC Zn-binding protein ZnuA
MVATLCLLLLSACVQKDATRLSDADEYSASNQVDDFVTDIEKLTPLGLGADKRLKVVVTTNIVADVVSTIGGDAIEMTALIPRGADPHTFEPTPQDYRTMEKAHVVFVNGAGLEEAMSNTLEQVAQRVPVVSLSQDVDLLAFASSEDYELDLDSEHADDDDAHEHASMDPHVWFDPKNVMVWTSNAAEAISTLHPQHASHFQANAEAYQDELQALDRWIQDEVEQLPEERRRLVTDHFAFQYFARRYGFEIVGAVIPAYSTSAQPSAKEIAALVDSIRALEVSAVFVGVGANQRLAAQAAQDTGAKLIPLYTGSLSAVDGPAATYLDLMRYDVMEIVRGLEE